VVKRQLPAACWRGTRLQPRDRHWAEILRDGRVVLLSWPQPQPPVAISAVGGAYLNGPGGKLPGKRSGRLAGSGQRQGEMAPRSNAAGSTGARRGGRLALAAGDRPRWVFKPGGDAPNQRARDLIDLPAGRGTQAGDLARPNGAPGR